MNRLATALLTFTVVLLTISAVQAADYAALKSDYISSHPGQSIIPYPWEPTTSIKVLPINYEIPAAPGNSFAISACRDEFEPASFIISSQKDLSGITITVPDLSDGKGNTIPSSALDVRLVKVWYQSSSSQTDIHSTGGYYLTPELLLKDDSLVKVDYATKTNSLKVSLNGVTQYIDISSPTATFPAAAQVRDAATLQPFSLKAQENKQIWLTVHVPGTIPAGNYSGTIQVNSPSETPVTMKFTVTVLPFDLAPSPLTYSIYYYGRLGGAPSYSYSKDITQYTNELQDLKDHGVLYPTLFQQDDSYLNTALSLRNQAGLPKDKIFLAGITSSQDMYIGNPTDPAGLATVASTVTNWRNHVRASGYADVYFYGIDEAKADVLKTERPAWQTVHDNGGKVFAAAGAANLQTVADVLDTAVVAYAPNTTIAGIFHRNNHEVFDYSNPQAGIENPEIYRKNFGYVLWNAGYDGAMNFAYQFRYGGSVWNDYDHASYRDHVYAYPTINGVIDTIQWEGFREGVDDTRYVASLIKKEGSATSAKSLISSSLSKGDSAGTIRNKVIGQILGSYTPGQVPTPTPSPTPLPTPTPTPTPIPAHSLPSAQFTASATKGVTPLTVQFTDTSVSTGTTTYEWDINNDGVVDSTVKNPSLTYTITGTKTVKLTVKNASGSDTEVKTGYITVSLPATKNPKAKFTASGTKGVKPMIVQFTDQSESTGTTTYEWDVNNDGVVESTVKNPSITYTIPGTKTVKLTVKNASGSDSEVKTNYITVSSPTGTTSPAITVTSPNGGETWKRGTTQTVTWNYAGSAGSTVKLVLLKGSTVIGTIKDSVSIGSGGKGSYSWPIALSGTGGTGTGYKVSIQSTSQPTVKDTSNNYFTLSPGTTTVSGSVVIGGDPVVTVRSGN